MGGGVGEACGALDWCAAREFNTGDEFFLPHLFVSLDFTLTDGHWLERSSAGLALGTCESEAIATGLLEVLERDAVGAWEPLRPSLSSRNASEDVLLHVNASGLPEDPTAAAYVTEVQMEVISLTGAARVHTLGIAASVTAEAVATASGWGTVEPHGRCSESELALVAQEVGGSAVVVAEVGHVLGEADRAQKVSADPLVLRRAAPVHAQLVAGLHA